MSRFVKIELVIFAIIVIASLVVIAYASLRGATQCYHSFMPHIHTPVNYCPGKLTNH